MYKQTVLLLQVLAFAYVVNAKLETKKREKPIRKAIVDDIKNKTKTWTPFAPEENPLVGLDTDELYFLAGTNIDGRDLDSSSNTTVTYKGVKLPTSFDARTKWSTCIHPILSQGKCAGCWAFGASSTFTDRVCIRSNKRYNVVLS